MGKATSVRFDEATIGRLDELARSRGSSRSEVIEDAVLRLLEYNDWFTAAVEQGLREADAGEFEPLEEVDAVFARWGAAGD